MLHVPLIFSLVFALTWMQQFWRYIPLFLCVIHFIIEWWANINQSGMPDGYRRPKRYRFYLSPRANSYRFAHCHSMTSWISRPRVLPEELTKKQKKRITISTTTLFREEIFCYNIQVNITSQVHKYNTRITGNYRVHSCCTNIKKFKILFLY